MVNFSSQRLKIFTDLVNKNLFSVLQQTQIMKQSYCTANQKVSIVVTGKFTGDVLHVKNTGYCDLKTMFGLSSSTDVKNLAQNALDQSIQQDSKQNSGLIGFLTANVSMSSQEIKDRLTNICSQAIKQLNTMDIIERGMADQNFRLVIDGEYDVKDTIIENQLQQMSNVIINTISNAILSNESFNTALLKDKQSNDQKSEGISDIISSFSGVLFGLAAVAVAVLVLPGMMGDDGNKRKKK